MLEETGAPRRAELCGPLDAPVMRLGQCDHDADANAPVARGPRGRPPRRVQRGFWELWSCPSSVPACADRKDWLWPSPQASSSAACVLDPAHAPCPRRRAATSFGPYRRPSAPRGHWLDAAGAEPDSQVRPCERVGTRTRSSMTLQTATPLNVLMPEDSGRPIESSRAAIAEVLSSPDRRLTAIAQRLLFCRVRGPVRRHRTGVPLRRDLGDDGSATGDGSAVRQPLRPHQQGLLDQTAEDDGRCE
jgi:hypothetical protein